MGRPPKFKAGARNLSVYLPEEMIAALRQYAAHQYAATGQARRASDVIFDALRTYRPLRDFVEKPPAEVRSAPTWDEVLGGRVGELERKRN